MAAVNPDLRVLTRSLAARAPPLPSPSPSPWTASRRSPPTASPRQGAETKRAPEPQNASRETSSSALRSSSERRRTSEPESHEHQRCRLRHGGGIEDHLVQTGEGFVENLEGDVPVVDDVVGETPTQAGRGQDHKLLVGGRREPVDEADVERALKQRRAEHRQLGEISASGRSAELDGESGGGVLGVIAGDREDASLAWETR